MIGPKYKSSNFDGDRLDGSTQYRRLIRYFMYLTFICQDITYVVHCLSKCIRQHNLPCLQTSTHLLRFLKLNHGQGLFLSSTRSAQLRAFNDLDCACCHDTCKFVTSFCVFIGNLLYYWKSKKQSIVSRFPTEVEYCDIASTTSEIFCFNTCYMVCNHYK